MLGFHARAENTDIVLNDEELEDARWFAKGEIPELIASGELVLPSGYAIARTLFDEWYES
jgi:NAD+ diphosphatase